MEFPDWKVANPGATGDAWATARLEELEAERTVVEAERSRIDAQIRSVKAFVRSLPRSPLPDTPAVIAARTLNRDTIEKYIAEAEPVGLTIREMVDQLKAVNHRLGRAPDPIKATSNYANISRRLKRIWKDRSGRWHLGEEPPMKP